MHIHPSSRFPATLIPIVLAFSIAPVPVLGADTSKPPAAAPEIEAGKLADLVVLDRNLFAIDANQISEAKVLLTLLGGKPVYGNWNDLGD